MRSDAARSWAIAWNLFFAKYDLLLLSPTVAVQPFEVGKNLPMGPDARPTRCGRPIPRSSTEPPPRGVGALLEPQGLPIGLQIAAAITKTRSCCARRRALPRPSPEIPRPAGDQVIDRRSCE